MLLWEIDRPLHRLAALYGFERAARAYRASFEAVAGLKALVRGCGVACDMRDKNSLYLAAGDSAAVLSEEHEARRRAGLPGEFLDHPKLLELFGIARAGAIVSPAAADADPLQLSRGLLALAVSRGARLFEGEAVAFDAAGRSVTVGLENGCAIETRSVVLATGYVMPDIVRSTAHEVSSSWAIATRPQPQCIWPDGALIWEAKQRLSLCANNPCGTDHPRRRGQRRRGRARRARSTHRRRSRAFSPRSSPRFGRAPRLDVEYRWAGTFDTTSDGLPLIGPVPGAKGIYAAYGYGGNGITFSFLAAQLIGGLIAGATSPLLQDFAIDREVSGCA